MMPYPLTEFSILFIESIHRGYDRVIFRDENGMYGIFFPKQILIFMLAQQKPFILSIE